MYQILIFPYSNFGLSYNSIRSINNIMRAKFEATGKKVFLSEVSPEELFDQIKTSKSPWNMLEFVFCDFSHFRSLCNTASKHDKKSAEISVVPVIINNTDPRIEGIMLDEATINDVNVVGFYYGYLPRKDCELITKAMYAAGLRVSNHGKVTARDLFRSLSNLKLPPPQKNPVCASFPLPLARGIKMPHTLSVPAL